MLDLPPTSLTTWLRYQGVRPANPHLLYQVEAVWFGGGR